MKLITVLLNLSHYLYDSIQCAKTRNSVDSQSFEVQQNICLFKTWSLKDTQNLLRMSILYKNFEIMSPKVWFDSIAYFFWGGG